MPGRSHPCSLVAITRILPAMDATPSRIDLYWRPGCGFCSSLRRSLDALGVERVEHDIWSDPHAAAVVRSHAGGNETVPTVVIDGVGLVNPSASRGRRAAAARAR